MRNFSIGNLTELQASTAFSQSLGLAQNLLGLDSANPFDSLTSMLSVLEDFHGLFDTLSCALGQSLSWSYYPFDGERPDIIADRIDSLAIDLETLAGSWIASQSDSATADEIDLIVSDLDILVGRLSHYLATGDAGFGFGMSQMYSCPQNPTTCVLNGSSLAYESVRVMLWWTNDIDTIGCWGTALTFDPDQSFLIDLRNLLSSIRPIVNPNAPLGVSASDSTYGDKIRINWNDVAGEDGYDVYRATSSGGSYAWIGMTSADVTEYDDEEPDCGDSNYYYKVSAWNAGGDSTKSAYDVGNTSVCPPVVIGFSINDGASLTTNRTVTLNNSTSGSPTHYMASDYSSFSDASWKTYSVAPSYTLSSGSGYKHVYFKVKNAGGDSPYSYDSINLEEPPTTPTQVSASDGDFPDKIRVEWVYSVNADGYNLYRATNPDGPYTVSESIWYGLSEGSLFYYDYAPECGSTYYYKIAAFNTVFTSDLSESDTGYTADCPIDIQTGPPLALNTNAESDIGEDFSPTLATNGTGTWIATWYSNDSLNDTIGTDNDILFAVSTDNGVTWGTPTSLNPNAGSDAQDDRWPQIATDGTGTWIVTWSLYYLDGIQYSIATDNGTTWSTEVALSESGRIPQLETDRSGNWVIIWEDAGSIMRTVSTNHGTT